GYQFPELDNGHGVPKRPRYDEGWIPVQRSPRTVRSVHQCSGIYFRTTH
ncbi:hypothetical protein NPIL_142831, partial [Nephila pilipes]